MAQIVGGTRLDSGNSCMLSISPSAFFPAVLVRLWGEDNLHFTQGKLDAVEMYHSSEKRIDK